MPNWCENVLYIKHNDPEQIKRLANAAENGRILDEFVPCPKELHITAGTSSNPIEQRKIELQEKFNQEKYGYKNWYDFQTAEWGTKWDVHTCDITDQDENSITIVFQSAWSPPVSGISTMCQENGFTAKLFYHEGGEAFCGKYDSESGEDEYFNLSNLESTDELENVIPRDILDEFNLVEFYAEIFNENEPDEYEDDDRDKPDESSSANTAPSI